MYEGVTKIGIKASIRVALTEFLYANPAGHVHRYRVFVKKWVSIGKRMSEVICQ